MWLRTLASTTSIVVSLPSRFQLGRFKKNYWSMENNCVGLYFLVLSPLLITRRRVAVRRVQPFLCRERGDVYDTSKYHNRDATANSRSLAVCMCLAMVVPFITLNSVAQQPFLQYTAAAYGTYAAVGSIINVAQTAPVSIGAGCGTPAVGVVQNGTLASLNVFPLVQTGLINTQASTALNTATGSSDLHQIACWGASVSPARSSP